jgi:hypothetical protein
MRQSILVVALILTSVLAIPGQAQRGQGSQASVDQHIATFDDLDFNVFTHQKWDEVKKSHSKDIVVHWPDGHQTKGIEKHIEDLKAMFVYAPDTRILEHPVKFGSGPWTSVIGVMEGTFTKPMPVPNGPSIPPTGKAFKLPMNTVGSWNAQGTMDEEYLFWDNQTYMRQLGLVK